MKELDDIQDIGFDNLEEQFGIKVRHYDCGLNVLSYSQIDSPKQHPITKICRGLILDDDYTIVARPFDRFFNLGECESTFDPNKSVVYEKVDGSLIKIYNWNGHWYTGTRGTAFAETSVNGFGITFKDLIMKAMGGIAEEDFQDLLDEYLNPQLTYILELTSKENRVVTRYSGYKLWFLACRDNKTGEYGQQPNTEKLCWFLPSKYEFGSIDDCITAAKSLKDLKEGYVAYQNGIPVCKIKSPAYVAVHHIRGEGLTPKRVCELVCTGEEGEYLKYFPEDIGYIQPYKESLSRHLENIRSLYEEYCHIEDRKEFAIKVKDSPYSSIMFMAKNNGCKLGEDAVRIFNSQDIKKRVKLMMEVRV